MKENRVFLSLAFLILLVSILCFCNAYFSYQKDGQWTPLVIVNGTVGVVCLATFLLTLVYHRRLNRECFIEPESPTHTETED
jgi:hypothetical protein